MGSLTQDEIDHLLIQLAEQTAPNLPGDDDAVPVLKWAERARLRQVMLELALDGDLVCRIENGEPRFFASARARRAGQSGRQRRQR